jgi:hypothetical protein
MDINKARNIVIVVEDRRHQAEFLEKTPDGQLIFKILERDHPYIKTKTGHKCQVLMTIDAGKDPKKFFIEGKISSEQSDRAFVWVATNLMNDRRCEIRHNILPVFAKLETKRFLRVVTIPANITNISKSGAGINTNCLLNIGSVYKIETKFRIRHTLRPFSAIFNVRYSIKRGNVYINSFISGGEFEKSSMLPEYIQSLNEYLKNLEE